MNMFYGVLSRSGVPSDEQKVRATTEKIDPIGEEPAVAHDDPEQGHLETDKNPNLSGLVNRQLASEWVEGEQFAPSWVGNVDRQAVNSVIVDGQVSSAGDSAHREASGVFGHGSMSYAIGIEPVQDLTMAGGFGNNYFAADRPGIQSTMGSYMSVPPGMDRDTTGLVSDTTRMRARYAEQASLYATWLGQDR